MKTMLQEHPAQNFVAVKFTELLTEKCREGLWFSKIVTIYVSSVLTFFCHSSFCLCFIGGKCPLFL
jgi:hypothetical protein